MARRRKKARAPRVTPADGETAQLAAEVRSHLEASRAAAVAATAASGAEPRAAAPSVSAAAILSALAASTAFQQYFWEQRPVVLEFARAGQNPFAWSAEQTLAQDRHGGLASGRPPVPSFFLARGIASGETKTFEGESLQAHEGVPPPSRAYVLRRLAQGSTWGVNHAEQHFEALGEIVGEASIEGGREGGRDSRKRPCSDESEASSPTTEPCAP